MKRRQMSPDPLRIFKKEQWPDELFNSWKPNDYDLKVIRTAYRQRKLTLNQISTNGMVRKYNNFLVANTH